MYSKAILFNDDDTAEEILRSKDPSKQKRLGIKVEKHQDFNRNTWNNRKEAIMQEILICKF